MAVAKASAAKMRVEVKTRACPRANAKIVVLLLLRKAPLRYQFIKI
jgi:hypothetical protein